MPTARTQQQSDIRMTTLFRQRDDFMIMMMSDFYFFLLLLSEEEKRNARQKKRRAVDVSELIQILEKKSHSMKYECQLSPREKARFSDTKGHTANWKKLRNQWHMATKV